MMMWRKLALALGALILAGCTTPVVQSDVTRFSQNDALLGVQSFTIRPHEHQIGSLEFQQYATYLANELTNRGWVPVAPGSGIADANVYLTYQVNPAVTEIYRNPSMYTGFGTGYYGRRRGSALGLGFGMPLGGSYYDYSSYTRYPKEVRVVITDNRTAPMGGYQPTLFEGRAVSASSRRDLTTEMPYMLQALFQNFPGPSGQTVRVTVPME